MIVLKLSFKELIFINAIFSFELTFSQKHSYFRMMIYLITKCDVLSFIKMINKVKNDT